MRQLLQALPELRRCVGHSFGPHLFALSNAVALPLGERSLGSNLLFQSLIGKCTFAEDFQRSCNVPDFVGTRPIRDFSIKGEGGAPAPRISVRF